MRAAHRTYGLVPEPKEAGQTGASRTVREDEKKAGEDMEVAETTSNSKTATEAEEDTAARNMSLHGNPFGQKEEQEEQEEEQEEDEEDPSQPAKRQRLTDQLTDQPTAVGSDRAHLDSVESGAGTSMLRRPEPLGSALSPERRKRATRNDSIEYVGQIVLVYTPATPWVFEAVDDSSTLALPPTAGKPISLRTSARIPAPATLRADKALPPDHDHSQPAAAAAAAAAPLSGEVVLVSLKDLVEFLSPSLYTAKHAVNPKV